MLQLFILVLLVYNSKSETTPCDAFEEVSTTVSPCGSYGFRCIDEQTYQICETHDSEGFLETPELSRDCFAGLVCDEENPAFCTPIDDDMTAAKQASEVVINRRDGSEMFDNNGDEITCVYNLDVESTTEPEDLDAEDTTPSFVQSPFKCPGFGQYPDSVNKSMYWFCDVNSKGDDFEVKHMCCEASKVFDSSLRECVTIGTLRETRSVPSKQSLLRICRINRKTHRFRLKRGDCQDYYLCYNHNQDIIKMQCPRYYQFSERYSRCMPENLVDCNAQNGDIYSNRQ